MRPGAPASPIAEQLGRELAALLPACDFVAAPALGGLIIGHEVARAMGVPFLFTERDIAGENDASPRILGPSRRDRRGDRGRGHHRRQYARGDPGASGIGRRVVGAGSIIDRSGGSADLGVPRVALATLQVKSWDPEHCPLCQQGIPVSKPGSRPVGTDTRMRRIRITLSYDGTNYHGWQVQPELPTIQGTLEAVLDADRRRDRLRSKASGRTDAGRARAGASGRVQPGESDPCRRICAKRSTGCFPRDIRVLSAEEAAPDFHPRFGARAKTYEYRILRAEICSPFDRLYVYHHPYPLNEAKMTELAPLLEGEHDFSAFAASDETDELGRCKVRRIFSSRLRGRATG